jgi:hypothetical protein
MEEGARGGPVGVAQRVVRVSEGAARIGVDDEVSFEKTVYGRFKKLASAFVVEYGGLARLLGIVVYVHQGSKL